MPSKSEGDFFCLGIYYKPYLHDSAKIFPSDWEPFIRVTIYAVIPRKLQKSCKFTKPNIFESKAHL